MPATGLDRPTSGSCAAGRARPGRTVRLAEFEWLWDAAIANDCTGILGGNSGSPMFAADDDTVAVGIINTTTIGAAPGGSCSLGQPCEVGPAGAVEVPDRSYAMPLAAWAACWAPSFDIANDGCPAEQPPVVTVDAPLRAVRPGATWSATIGNGGPDRPTVVKTGPASSTDCRDPGRLRRARRRRPPRCTTRRSPRPRACTCCVRRAPTPTARRRPPTPATP